MQVWLTGGQGFVGRRLAARLLAEGMTVEGTEEEVDVTNPDAVLACLRATEPATIVHLAGISFVPDAARDPLLAWRVNYAGTRILLDTVARHAPETRVLVVTSAMVYGTREVTGQRADAAGDEFGEGFDEEASLSPRGPYATSKAAADLLSERYAAAGLDVVRLRPFNHTGAGRPDTFVESSFAKQVAEMERGQREPVMRVGNLDAIRDFLHVDDVVDAYLRLIEPGGPGGVFNVSSGRATPIRSLLGMLLAESSVEPRIEVGQDLWRETDANFGNAERLAAATGWAPRLTLEATLREILEHWRTATSA